MSEPRCEISDLVTTQCAHCRGLDDPRPTRQLGRIFPAAYSGHCRDCGEPYEPDDRIRRVSDDDGTGYLGPCCATEASA